MNPFLHDTVARPQPSAATPAQTSAVAASVPSVRAPAAAVAVPAVVVRLPTAVVPAAPGRRSAASAPPRAPASGHRVRTRAGNPLARAFCVLSLTTLAWAGAVGAVDLNSASLDQLKGIRGIGPKTAQIILDERSRGGRYLSFADLSDRVRGIGPRRAQAMQSAGLTIDGGGTRVSGQGAQARQAAEPPPAEARASRPEGARRAASPVRR
ncbi:ComEA family DNA-binding protein [Castellaniella caeni]|uniref:ComEA family DNA-binding protein n=1 Tax=Castellaniella caeni TaxID=266123 RepID=UPI000A025DC1|nr:helix-hairpin-helix domain-containing protein [Castellaniella caeni]